MTQKTKFEKKDTAETRATFSLDEVASFSAYANFRRKMYLDKMLSREPNRRLDELGQEVLNPHSVVAEVDMQPLSMRQNLARFVTPNFNPDDYYDADTTDDSDESFIADDRADNIPTPHELRARDLDRKLDRARKAYRDATEAAREAGEGDPPEPKNETPKASQGSKEPPKSPSE